MELVTLKFKNLLTSTQLILSKYDTSKNLSVQKNQYNQIEFCNNADNRYDGQAYLDFILDAAANYVLQIKLEQQEGQDKQFLFGLMKDSDKDTEWGYYENLSYYEQEGDSGLNTLVKGKSILTDKNDYSLVSRSLEVRINIQRKMLRVGSLPNYDSVVQADNPEKINADTPYRFFLWGLKIGTKMTIVKLKTVSQFDNLM